MNRNYLFLKFSSAFSTIWDSLSWFLQNLSLLAFFLSLRLFPLLYHSKDPLIWQPLKYWCPRSKYSPFILNNVSSQFCLHSWFKPTTHLLTSTSVFPAYTLVLNSCVICLIAVSCLVDKSWLVFFFFVSPWTVAQQVPLSMEFSWQENWSGLPFPSPGDLPNPGIEPLSPALAGRFLTRRNLHNWANWGAPIIAIRRSKNGPIISPH